MLSSLLTTASRRRGWWRLRLPPALEPAYARARMQARTRSVDACNLLGSAVFGLTTAADADHVPAHAHTIAALHWAVTAFLFASSAFGIRRGARRRTWEQDAAITLTMIVLPAYALVLNRLAPSPISAVTSSGMFLTIMYSAIVVRQQFWHAVGVALYVLGTYAAMTWNDTGIVGLIADSNLRLFSTAAILSLVANYVLERRQRHEFVLRLREAEQQTALADGVRALHRLSHCDPLTGVANRRHFDNLLDAAWIDAGQTGRVGLLLLDIDHFKRYNDHYGHPVGDTCLQAVAGAVEAAARAHGGVTARIGGEEFAVLLPGLRQDAGERAAATATAVCAAVRSLAIDHAHSMSGAIVTVSVGVAVARPMDGLGIAGFQAAADVALYEAKDAGRDRWMVWSAPVRTGSCAALPSAGPAAAPAPSTAPPDLASDDPSSVAWRERLQAAANRSGWRLRFFPELEADLDRTLSRARGVRLFLSGLAGTLFAVVYVRLSGAMFPQFAPIVDDAMQTVALTVDLPLLMLLLLPMGTWLRESIFGLGAVLIAVTFCVIGSVAPTIQIENHALAVFLAPMFCAVIVEQPFRHCVAASLGTWLISARLLWPGWNGGEVTTAWMLCTGMSLFASLYALIGGYLLERSTRRNHLLTRLDEAHGIALRQQTEHLRRLATVDPVTGIANRRHFDGEQARLWTACAAAGRPLALLLLDVDHFKRYNDVYGHPGGDAGLRRIAQALSTWSSERAARGGMAASAARLGGEEFGVLLPGCGPADALVEAESLCKAIAALRIDHAGSPTSNHLTVSVGAAAAALPVTDLASTPTALLSAADAALYRAKQAGRNRASA